MCPLCLSVSQDCGFSLEDPLRETHCTGGHPALVQGHGIVLEYYVVLCLVGSASRACLLCHSLSQDCGFSLEDLLTIAYRADRMFAHLGYRHP